METNDKNKGHRCYLHGGHCARIERLESDVLENRDVVRDARKSLHQDMDRLFEDVKNNYVSKDVFDPIKKLVYGIIGLMVVYVVQRVFLR